MRDLSVDRRDELETSQTLQICLCLHASARYGDYLILLISLGLVRCVFRASCLSIVHKRAECPWGKKSSRNEGLGLAELRLLLLMKNVADDVLANN